MSGHFVYLISNTSGRTKIGHSRNVTNRKASLATASAEKLKVEARWRLPREEAIALEGRLLKMFRWARTYREWHAIPAYRVDAVIAALVAGEEGRALELVALLEAISRDETDMESHAKALDLGLPFRGWTKMVDGVEIPAPYVWRARQGLQCGPRGGLAECQTQGGPDDYT